MRAIVWKEFRALSSSVFGLLIHLITPLFLLIFFATVLSKNLVSFSYNGIAIGYLEYFTPGLVGYITFMTFQLALTFIRHEKSSGMLGIIVISYGDLSGYIGGKIIAQSIINIIKVIAIVLLALFISANHVMLFSFNNIMLFLIAIILGTGIWLSIGLAIALLLKRDDLREMLVMLIAMPLTFGSSMYYDISRAPIWIQYISNINPLTYTCNLARKAYLLRNPEEITQDLLVLVIMFIVSLLISIYISKQIDY